eukprot:1972878-Rhodomonas_salina.2
MTITKAKKLHHEEREDVGGERVRHTLSTVRPVGGIESGALVVGWVKAFTAGPAYSPPGTLAAQSAPYKASSAASA